VVIQSCTVWYVYPYFEINLLLLNREIKPTYRDAISERKNLIFEIKKIIIQHPLLGGKVKLPDIEIHRLHHLLSQRFHSTILVWSWYAYQSQYAFICSFTANFLSCSTTLCMPFATTLDLLICISATHEIYLLFHLLA